MDSESINKTDNFYDVYGLYHNGFLAEMISAALHFTYIDMEAFEKQFHISFKEKFAKGIGVILENNLMEIREEKLHLTGHGTDYINRIIRLFCSQYSEKKLSTAHPAAAEDEESFLSSYNADDYDRPSVAADIVVFSMMNLKDKEPKRSPDPRLKVLLIKRGEHPYMNKWALPGGFLRKNETIEECALREVTEETNVTPKALIPVGVFSEPERDIRTRVVSNAFVSVVDADEYSTHGGNDAAEAEWFDVSFNTQNENKIIINLSCGDTRIDCLLEAITDHLGNTTYSIIENGGLAFDHAKIIASAFSTMRKMKDEYELVFHFLPEKFTLSSMQKIHEIINNISDQPANFRRKVMNYVAETDEYEDCTGHRPAKLYERKL